MGRRLTDVRPWQIWRVWVPFREDPTNGKYRSVVIKEITEDGCVVIYVTSQVGKTNFPDFLLIHNWEEAGLNRASAVRYRRLLKIPLSALGEYVGELSPYDRIELQMKYQFH